MRIMRKTLAWWLSAVLMVLPMVSAQAAMVGTGEIVGSAASRAGESRVRDYLKQESVRQQLQAWGISADSLDQRVSRLTDSELARINQSIESQQAGGSSILGLLVLIFLVFVITDVIGATDIFPFIHPVK